MSEQDAHSPDPLIGKQIREYLILSKVGEGGMGAVYKAYHQILKQPRALKVLRRDLLGDQSFIARFLREAQILVEINHVHIARFFEFFRHEDGTFFMAMEFVEGERIDQRLKSKGRLSEAELLPIFRQVCSAIAEAHRLGIVHRDLSPDNIILVKRGMQEDVKILDFGIAKGPGSQDRTQIITEAGTFVGKYRYCSPEQAQGAEEGSVDQRSDLYSLGVVMYEMLSGKLPYEAGTLQAYLLKQTTEDPIPLWSRVPGVNCSPQFGDLIHKMLERDREKRPQNVHEVLDALSRIEAQGANGMVPGKRIGIPEPEKVRPEPESTSRPKPIPPPPTALISWMNRHAKSFGIGAVTVPVVVALLYFFIPRPPIPPNGPGTAVIVVTSNPSGASITIDGALQLQKTPSTIPEIQEGKTHTLEIEKEGYARWAQEFRLEAGAVRVFTARLKQE